MSIVEEQKAYLDEQIGIEYNKCIQSFSKEQPPDKLESIIVDYYNNEMDAGITRNNLYVIFDTYKYSENEHGTVTFYLVKDKNGELPTTQWVLTGYKMYTKIDYPSIYLGANLFQHDGEIYTVSDNGIDYLTGVFAIHTRDIVYTHDEEAVKAKLSNYVHRLTGRHPNYTYAIDNTTNGTIYLALNLQLSPPMYDNPWGEQLDYVSSRVCIQKPFTHWMYTVTTMNLPGTRHMFYDDAFKDASSEIE